MKYQYLCSSCDTEFIRRRPVSECTLPADCDCGAEAKRIFSADFQVNADRMVDRAENKYALGFDAATRRETQKADDAIYEKHWRGKNPSKPKAPESLTDMYVKEWGAG